MFEWLKVISDFAALIVSVIALIGTFLIWRSNRNRADSKDVETKMGTIETDLSAEIKKVETSVQGVDTRVSKIETALTHLPNDKDINGLHDRISGVRNSVTSVANQVASALGVMQGMAEGIKTLQKQTQTLYDNELAEARAAKKGN